MNEFLHLLHPTTWPEVAGLLIVAVFAAFLLYVIALGLQG